nr:hypothetical protein GCM10020185_68740 [Pseudomonas brassicacearum subsp. brassicacearum]
MQVEEPDELTAVEMLRGVASKLEQHHGVQVLDAAIHEAVKLSHRYISGRQLPDKAISVLDTACARVALGQHDVPPPLESLRHRQNSLKDEVERLRREQATGLDHRERITLLEDESTSNVQAIRELETRWGEEREAVRELLDTRRELLALSERADSEKKPTPRSITASTTWPPNCCAWKLAWMPFARTIRWCPNRWTARPSPP